ncbi:MAG: ATP-binding protein [Litorilituus sp.]|nr:ATP-binding protein [Litorilituus sp.]
MKFYKFAMASSIGIILFTLMTSWIIFIEAEKSQQDHFFKVSQLNILEKKKQLLHHEANINAIKAFFEASNLVTKDEFRLFTSKLIKQNNIFISTLNHKSEWDFASSDNFSFVEEQAIIMSTPAEIPVVTMPGHTVFTAKLSQDANPYLVYIIADSVFHSMLDASGNLCLQLIDKDKIIENPHCAQSDKAWFNRLKTYKNSVFVTINSLNKYYTIAARLEVCWEDHLDLLGILCVISLMGIFAAYMLFFRIRINQKNAQQNIENNSKLALLSSINHEIRTPINAVLGYSAMLKKTVTDNTEQKKLIESVIWSANMLNSVAENTLSYSRAEAGLLKLYNAPVNLDELLQRIRDNYHSYTAKSNKRLEVHPLVNISSFIKLDISVFFQLTTNIINNSFKYSSGALVDCYVSTVNTDKGSFLRVSVRDYGQGMAVKARSVFNKPFTTGNSANQMGGQSGIGVGLYTCKKIIDSIGGQIFIRSTINKGTLVIFRFPYEHNERSARIDVSQLKGKSVLLVDDNEMNLELCSRSLVELGMKVSTFTSGNMALASIHDLKPEIIISDYKLDDTDGLTLIKQLKIVHSSAQYFILSANERSEILSDDIETDINFLQKPFNQSDFLGLIKLC